MRIAKLAIAVLLAAACSRSVKVETDPRTGRPDVDVQKAGAAENWTGTFNAVGGSGIAGTATGTTTKDSTHVTINITGAQAGATLPWHVHDGKCTESAPIVGAASLYPPLVVGSDGRATGIAHLPMKLNEAKDYSINVHASPTNMGTIVACAAFTD
ncbi:MAG TPA: hypothetical protein VM939_12925 [Gemmatimonadaceae bacterium]|nr:hypothetical protein [Gemmatimonadaceae bacterium]